MCVCVYVCYRERKKTRGERNRVGGNEREGRRERVEREGRGAERGERAPHTHTHPQAIAVQTTLRGHESGTWGAGNRDR